jgi:hypothetical protein
MWIATNWIFIKMNHKEIIYKFKGTKNSNKWVISI